MEHIKDIIKKEYWHLNKQEKIKKFKRNLINNYKILWFEIKRK